MRKHREGDIRPPGDLLLNCITKMGIEVPEFARLIPCSPAVICAIILDGHEITEMMAKKLEKILKIPANHWLEHDRNYRKQEMRYLEARLDELG